MSREVERVVNADRVEDLISVFGSFVSVVVEASARGLLAVQL